MSNETSSDAEPAIIKKYANRRLYNTDTSTYVTLDDLALMVRAERDFVVYDAKTGDELTHSVLTQIIVEQESKGQNLLPIRFLRQLIRLYGDSLERLVPSYLEFSMDALTRDQDRYREQFANTFGNIAVDAMQEQARKNIKIFEKAMGLFTPFGPAVEKGGGAPSAKTTGAATGKPTQPASGPLGDTEIDTLRAQLSAMQERLEQLSKRAG